MKRLLHSFDAKLSGTFLVLIAVLGVAIALLSVHSATQYMNEAAQKLNRTLAADLAPRLAPFVRGDSINYAGLQDVIEKVTSVNRRIEIYLLDGEGHVKALLGRPDQPLGQARVDMEPIRRFLAGAELPILGEDPLHEGRRKPFSVAPIFTAGEMDCYLYILLGSDQFASVADMIKNSYILQTTLKGLGLILLFTAFVGVGLFTQLTRRLRTGQEVMEAFETGRHDQRIAVTSKDEIGQLGAAFNRMADTIVRNMDALKRTDRLRRELITNVSHDLRSPIASIQVYLETILIKDRTLGPEAHREYVATALKNAQRLGLLVEELFELSKLDAREVEPRIEPFALTELVHDLILQFKPRARERDVHLAAELPTHLTNVYADIALIERVLSNLIDNALRYTPSGGTVRVDLRDEGDTMRVRVTDTGPGIPLEDLPHIFERFYRVEKSRDRVTGGAGLGLAIAKKILELHNSTLKVRSALGQGATFSFTLPVQTPTPRPA